MVCPRADVRTLPLLAERSRRAFDLDREPFLDPRFSARTHEFARSITARTETTRAPLEREEKMLRRLRRKRWLEKQLRELDAEMSMIKEEAWV